MKQHALRLFVLFVFVSLMCSVGAFADYVRPVNLLIYDNVSPSHVSVATFVPDDKDFKDTLSIDVPNTNNSLRVSTLGKSLDKVLEENNTGVELNITPALIKKVIMSNPFEQVETFYLPEPITIAFLVIGMFLLFRKKRYATY